MRIAVCVKQVIDPQTPASEFSINLETNRAVLHQERKLLISDYDDIAVEAALLVKDAIGAEVIAITLAREPAEDLLRHTLAMGIDQGVLIKDSRSYDSDSFSTAEALAQAIHRLGDFDLILCGRQEGDWDAGQIGSGIAEFLNVPIVTIAGKITVQGNTVIVERIVTEGRELIEMPLPCLITVSNEIGVPRYPSLRRILEAKKKKLTVWNAGDIGGFTDPVNKMLELWVPPHTSHCSFINGQTPEAKGANLALKLKEANLV